MKIAIYPGSFDPCTYGHLDIIARAAKLTDTLVVAVMRNLVKTPMFSLDERVLMLRQCVDTLNLGKSIDVIMADGLVSDLAKSLTENTPSGGLDRCVIIKGVRDAHDFHAEQQMAALNQVANPKLETMLLLTAPKYAHLSSRSFKEFAHYGGELAHFAPQCVVDAVKSKLNS